MKRLTLIAFTIIITIALIAFSYSNWNGLTPNKLNCQTTEEIETPNFFYSLSPLYNNTITKEKIHNAKTISDLIPDHSIQENLKNNIISLRDVKIRIEEESLHHTKQKSEKVNGNNLNLEQINLLKSTDYASYFVLEGYITPNKLIGDLNEERYFNYYMSVIPEHQASYKAGKNIFIDYLKTECQETIAKIQNGNLKSGNISFTVTKAGTISEIVLKSTCGYPSVDKRMMALMNGLPEGWNAATNAKAEKVYQTLVFSFGQIGC